MFSSVLSHCSLRTVHLGHVSLGLIRTCWAAYLSARLIVYYPAGLLCTLARLVSLSCVIVCVHLREPSMGTHRTRYVHVTIGWHLPSITLRALVVTSSVALRATCSLHMVQRIVLNFIASCELHLTR